MDPAKAGKEVPITWRGRRAKAFVPTLLAERDLTLNTRVLARATRAEVEVAHAAADMPADFGALARLLLRAEGVASSYIEGVSAPVVEIVLAEESRLGEFTPSTWVAANLAAVTEAIDSAESEEMSVELLCRWHRILMAGSPTAARHVGVIRTEQGWIGGSSPLDAHLVTPPADALGPLLQDLVVYTNSRSADPITQAAIAHAQFEIIHPFADGNGRIGRVLIAWILTRRLSLLTPPPVSAAIASDVGGYAAGLTLFRLGDHDSWVSWFADAVSQAARAQSELVKDVDALKQRWRRQLGEPRGQRRRRSDSAAWRALDLFPRHVVLTSETVAGELKLTNKSANQVLDDLVEAGLLQRYGTQTTGTRGRPAVLYVSTDLLSLTGSSPL